ncbi:MAG: hypothetical protein AB1424_00360 [Thermodesulfobacteriota bacterium]
MKSNKILIKRGKEFYQFMWANLGHDGTVFIGFPGKGKHHIVSVIDDKIGEIQPHSIATEDFVGPFKISFHPSGQFKLMSKMGRQSDAIDRVTVEGPKLSDISEPRRMIEILLPQDFPILTVSQASMRDIVIDATLAPNKPLRCTISCMPLIKLQEIVTSGNKFVDTSVWEAAHGLQAETHAWLWTLRVSKNDNIYSDRLYIFLMGTVKWGQ